MKPRIRAKPNTPERYLWRKPCARHLWFRMAVPVRFRSIEVRKIVQQSLGTSDRAEASLRAAELRVRLIREWEIRLGGDTSSYAERIPSETDLHRAATTMGYVRTDDTFADWWAELEAQTSNCHRPYIEKLQLRRNRYIENRETSDLGLWRYIAGATLSENGWTLPEQKSHDRFAQMIAEAVIDRFRVEIEFKSGKFDAEPSSKVVRSGLAQVQSTAATGERIMDLFERYSEQRLAEKAKRFDTIEQDRKIIRQFASFIGESKAVGRISLADVRDWRDTIADLPPMFTSAKAYRELSLRAASAKAKTTGVQRMSPTTVNKYLSTVSPFFAWCVRNGYAEQNPCGGLFYDLQKGRNPRPPFSSSQLNQIFASPLFTGFERDGKEHLPGSAQARDWRYWIPLLCLFTGARISEIAQLNAIDIDRQSGVPFIHIRHSEKDGQTTKSGISRVTAIHPKLARLGFMDFAVARQTSGDLRLFPELRPNARGNAGAEASRFWRTYLKRLGMKEPGLGSHSFRHLLADRLREAGYLNEEIKVALGHRQKSVTSGYGRLAEGTAKRISEMLGKVEFEEIDHLVKQNTQ